MRDVLGFNYDVVSAVLAADADDVVDAVARAQALKSVLHMPEFQAIAAACKRMRNILKQAKEAGIEPAAKFQALPDSADEEKRLAAYVETYAPSSGSAPAEEGVSRGLVASLDGKRTGGRIFRQGHGHGGRRARPRKPFGAAANTLKGILHHCRFLRNRD